MENFDQYMAALKGELVKGIPVSTAIQHFKGAFVAGFRTKEEVQQYRVGRSFKVFREEVSPTLSFLKSIGQLTGEVRFEFGSGAPDGWFTEGRKQVGIEVTQVLGTQQAAMLKTMNWVGTVPGFIASSNENFSELYPFLKRKMYSTEDAIAAVEQSLADVLKKKSDPKFSGMILLVSAPLNVLSPKDWNGLQLEDAVLLQSSPFRSIALVDREESQAPKFIKGNSNIF